MTFVPDSPEAVRAFLEAEDIASRANQPLSSAHLLLALFTFPNRAQALLLDRGISEDTILEHIRVLEDEPKRIVQKIRDRGRELDAPAEGQQVALPVPGNDLLEE